MRKKVGFGLGAMALTFLLSSCWIMQSFTILDYTLTPGQATKAQFTVRPTDTTAGPNLPQFVLVGVPTGGDLTVQQGTWGTNGLFGGPMAMSANGNLATAIGDDCQSNGINFASLTGMTWKGFITPEVIRDRGQVEKKAIVKVGVKAAADASTGSFWTVIGVSGAWSDDGDDIPNAADAFFCNGIGTSAVFVKAA
jgi:hypothetical protein